MRKGTTKMTRRALRDSWDLCDAWYRFFRRSERNGDTGDAHLAVRADLTVSIGFIKQGLATEEGSKYVGSLVNTDIGIVLV